MSSDDIKQRIYQLERELSALRKELVDVEYGERPFVNEHGLPYLYRLCYYPGPQTYSVEGACGFVVAGMHDGKDAAISTAQARIAEWIEKKFKQDGVVGSPSWMWVWPFELRWYNEYYLKLKEQHG